MKTTIKEIFQEEGYSIPNYQRDYAWKDKNFWDLWEDLEEAIEYNKKGHRHFIGTMVVAKNEDNKNLYDIIDGQQRTTTIFMLLHVLPKGGIKIRSRPSKPKLLQNALGSGRKGEYQPLRKRCRHRGQAKSF